MTIATKDRNVFTGPRLRLARLFGGLTLAELGEQLAVSRQFVFQLESGSREPSDGIVRAASEALGVDPDFFFNTIDDEFREDQCNFRRRRGTPLNARHQALAHGTMFGQVVSYLDKALSLPPDGLPKIEYGGEYDAIERVAERCRVHWGLGLDRPIQSMTRLLENAGTVVSCFQGSSEKVDAFSRAGRRNIAVLSTLKGSACRARYDLAHELGHLVLHTATEPPQTTDEEKRREKEADRFAGAFLLPKVGFAREFPRQAIQSRIRWSDLLEFKSRWLVSLGAIIYRAASLGMLDAVQNRRANMSLRANRWHIGEPLDDQIPLERPEIIDLSFAEMKKGYGLEPSDVAKHLHMKPATFERVTGMKLPSEPEAPVTQRGAEVHRLDHYRKDKASS